MGRSEGGGWAQRMGSCSVGRRNGDEQQVDTTARIGERGAEGEAEVGGGEAGTGSESVPPRSGWDAETGGDAEDGLRPDVLVSLAAPKRCAGRFSGRHHFVAGRFVPDDVRRKFALRLPGYTGTDCVAAL